MKITKSSPKPFEYSLLTPGSRDKDKCQPLFLALLCTLNNDKLCETASNNIQAFGGAGGGISSSKGGGVIPWNRRPCELASMI